MKNQFYLLLITVITAATSCSKKDEIITIGDTATLVKERITYLPAGEEYKTYVQRYTYGAGGEVLKISNFLTQANGIEQPATYDSLVYINGRLDKNYGFQYDFLANHFVRENRTQYFYQNNLPEHSEIYLDGVNPALLVGKTFYTYENGREVMRKVYDGEGNLENGFSTLYDGSHIAELRYFNAQNKPVTQVVHHYTNGLLTATNEYDVEGGEKADKSSTRYEYQKGRLYKEIYTTMPSYYHFADSVVYKY